MNNVLTLTQPTEQGVVDFLKYLLEQKKVAGVLTLRTVNESGSVDYALVTTVRELDRATPLMPVMPANAAQILSSLTPSKKPIAAVIKPCELRGFVERVKREQGSLDNLLTISMTCGGVIPLEISIKNKKETLIREFTDKIKVGEIPDNIRPTCKACEYFVPMNADITVSMVGEEDLETAGKMVLNTQKAIDVASGYGTVEEGDLDEGAMKAHLTKRSVEKEILLDGLKTEKDGLDAMVDVFGKCIGCHGCSRVCPICYCVLCDFESHNYDQNVDGFKQELQQKGALRLPPDTVFFHLGRLTHMSFSCVGCGQCTDVCPADIPVASIFKKTGEATAALFDYIPGRDLKEDIPVMVFKEEEFSELGE